MTCALPIHSTFEHAPCWSFQNDNPSCTLCPWAEPRLHQGHSGLLIDFLQFSHCATYHHIQNLFPILPWNFNGHSLKHKQNTGLQSTQHKINQFFFLIASLVHFRQKRNRGWKVTFGWNSHLNLQKLNLCILPPDFFQCYFFFHKLCEVFQIQKF